MTSLGLFETMRFFNGHIVYLTEHLLRLEQTARFLEIPLPYKLKELEALIYKAAQSGGFKDAYVRLTLQRQARKGEVFIDTKEYKPFSAEKYAAGFKAAVISNQNFLPPRLKTTQRDFYERAFEQARKTGFDEALLEDAFGYMVEGTRSNVFLVKAKNIYTPSLNRGGLPGITRKAVFDLAKKFRIGIFEADLSVEDALKSEECFLTNSLMGIMPLTWLRNKRIGNRHFILTHFLMRKYALLLEYGSARNKIKI